ncbi:NAD-dependent epimerase/dehydratase family protein, partial [bacterium]
TKWVGELQTLNSASMFGTETVRVRPVNAYGPYEYYSPYRGVIPMFIYRALHDEPYTVYMGHRRIFDYIEDTCRTFANIVDNFKQGEVYNVGAKEEWEHDIKYISDLILKNLGKNDSKVTYKEAEPFTTRVKHMDFSKIRRDLNHNPMVPIEEGIPLAIKWMKNHYGIR